MKLRLLLKKIIHRQTGQTLIELLVTIGIAAILMPAFMSSFAATRIGRPQQDQRLQAIAYVREAEEAVRIIRDNGWSSVANGVSIGAATAGTTYCPQSVPGGITWELVALTDPTKTTTCDTPATGFTRSITIADVNRDASTHEISLSGTVDDPSTRAVTITVSWTNPIASSVSQTIYLTRHDSLSYLDTSTNDFTHGTPNGTTVTDIYDGEVQIGGGGSSDWCAPGTPITYQTSSNHNEYSISAFASTSTGVSNYAYTTFGDSSNQPALSKWIVPDVAIPTPTPGGTYTPNGEKTYGLFATGSAVFITSNKNNLTADIVDPSTLTETGTFQDSGGEAGRSIYVGYTNSGVEGFVTACTYAVGSGCSGSYKLYSFDYHTTPLTGSRTQNGSVSLTAEGKRVVVVHNIAYVAENSTVAPLEIFNVSNPASMTRIYSGNPVGSLQSTPQGATDIYVDASGDFGYLVTSYDSQADIFYLNFSKLTPTGGTISVDANQTTSVSGGGTMSPTGVITVSQNHVVVVGSGGNQYQVFYAPSLKRCVSSNNGMLNIGATVKAVSSVSEADGDNYAYLLTDSATAELQFIPGGKGAGTGGGGGGTGTFISQGLPLPNLTSNSTFNNFFPIADTPLPTSIKYQVGVAPTCSSSFTFVGPDGNTSSYYSTGSAVPILTSGGYQNPGECFKYKAILDSGGSTTASPILYQVNVNYSP